MFTHTRLDFAMALVLALSTAVALAPRAAKAAPVEIAVAGVAEARGHVRVQLCTRDTFLHKVCPYRGEAVATPGATVVRIDAVVPGEYAVQAFDDDTDKGVVHQNLLGIPRERIGFSNDAPLHMTGPRFEEAAFAVGEQATRVSLTLRRVFGAGG
jgi:uncharacterized protein (DUF2141 family)